MSDRPERTGLNRPSDAPASLAEGLVERGSDDRVSVKRILVPGFFFACGLLYVLGGLALRQLKEGDDYADEFRIQSTRVIQVPAPRGFIYDRNGVLLVGNRPRYNIVADLSVLRDEIREEYLRRYRNPATRSGAQGNARVAVLQRYLDKVNAVLGRDDKVDVRALARHMDPKRGKVGLDFPLLTDIENVGEVARFVDNFPAEYPLRLYVDSVRSYSPAGMAAPHVLGYLTNSEDFGEVDESDPGLAELLRVRRERDQSDSNLFMRYGGKVGKRGLELYWDPQLRGKPGWQMWTVNPKGYLYKRIKETRAEQGSHVFCSIDSEIQKAAQTALRSTVEYTHDKPLKGAIAVVDVGTGEILAMASYPDFDPNRFADNVPQNYLDELHASGGELNRAAQGVYPPGSTFKTILAVAGMRDGKLDPDEELECPNKFTLGNLTMREHDWQSLPSGFGMVDMAKMLRVSCNVYCYQMGLRIGIDDIAREAKRFGLDNRIALDTETTGTLIVPDPAWNKAHGWAGWSSGATMNVAIGQGNLRTTPLHMLGMIASVAGNRTHTDFTLVHDPSRDGKTLAHHAEPLGLNDYQRKRLLDGLRSCIQQGTGRPAQVPGLDLVGKTGTAEWTNKGQPTNLAWFTGFAPGDNPKVAIVVMVEGEHGATNIHGGAAAGKLAKGVLTAWLASQQKKTGLAAAAE